MRFDLHHIRVFLAVAAELHFRAAAERLHTTQPVVSRTIQSLEEAVGTQLFTRTTRSVQLTDAGRAFHAECITALSHLDAAVRMAQSAAEGKIGRLRVAYMDFAINGALPSVIEAFHARHPDIKIDLFHMATSDQKEALLASTIDIGFLIGPFVAPTIEHISFCTEKMVLLLPAAHHFANRKTLALKDLARERFVIGSPDKWAAFRSHFFTMCHRAGFAPSISQEASTSDGIFGLVAANTGIAIYPSCVRNIQRSGLVIRLLTDKSTDLETVVCWRTDATNAVQKRFVQFLRESNKVGTPRHSHDTSVTKNRSDRR